MKAFTCWCGREVPTRVPCYVTSHEEARIAFTIYQQIVSQGWTSAGSVQNADETLDVLKIGGTLTGLQRAGLIQHYTGDRDMTMGNNAVFEAGPLFPGMSSRLGAVDLERDPGQ
jgi:hypothetical protein